MQITIRDPVDIEEWEVDSEKARAKDRGFIFAGTVALDNLETIRDAAEKANESSEE